MKERQIKKNGKKAMHLLMRLDAKYYTPDSFSFEDGQFVAWYQCGGMEPEWDYEPAYSQLQTFLENTLSKYDFVETNDRECPVELVWEFKPDLSTAKKVFDLAKQLIVRGAA